MMNAIVVRAHIAAIISIQVFIVCTASSASNFYQPGHGVLLEWWLTKNTSSYYSNPDLTSDKLTRDNPDFKECPLFGANADSFEHTFIDTGKLQYGRYRAYFIAPQTGNHRFFAIFSSRCEIYLTTQPKGKVLILEETEGTDDNWSKRRMTGNYALTKGFAYLIEVLHYAYGDKKAFFRLGVRLPDSKTVRPISKDYLWRSMSFYKWAGLLVEKYDSMQFPNWASYSLSSVYAMNTDKYPNHPSSYHCKSSLYDESPNGFFGNYYALRYTGYIKETSHSDTISMSMHCDEMCDFNLTALGSPKQFLIRNYVTPGSVAIGTNPLNRYQYEPVEVFMAEANKGGYLRVTYQRGLGGVEKSWNKLLHNLNIVESTATIPTPNAQAINQTYIKVTLKSLPSLPSKENWKPAQKYVLFYQRYKSEPYIKLELNGSLPISVDITGLKNYTLCSFYAYYYGIVAQSTTLNFISHVTSRRSAEDVPGKPPASISGSPETSTSIRMTWDDVPLEFRYGIIRSYNMYFKKSSNNTWGKPITTTSRTYYITGLQFWTYYDVKISASTNPGEGAISSVVKVRTAEHSPTAAPPSFMKYEVTDAMILLRWDAIPAQYRNGILTGYSIMLRKKGLQSWQEIKVPAGKTSWTVDGLSQTTAYEVKIAGKTVVGLGNYTDVMVVITDAARIIEVMPTAYFTSLDFTDKVLTKHISKTVQVTTIEQCFRACLDCMKPDSGCSCSSFNIRRPASPSTSFTCEINASDHDACPFDFVKETGYQYYQIL